MLYRVFAESVGRYLDGVDRLVAELLAEVVADSAARPLADEARRLVAAWRALLELHGATGRRCAGCARRRSMCSVWRVANAYFVKQLPDESVRR